MNDQWPKLKRLFATASGDISLEQRRALNPRYAGGWEPPTVTTTRESLGDQKRGARAPVEPLATDGAIAGTWVVTSSDSRFWPILTCFIASLRDVARYQGRIAVIDYGLEEAQRRKLGEAGITVVAPHRKHILVIDRYFTLADYFRNDQRDIVVYFDADIWFADSIGEIFANPGILTGKLAAAKDVWKCDYYTRCSHPEFHPTVEHALSDVITEYGQTLQAGFIAGTTCAWTEYAALLEALLSEGFAKNQWGADALALNFFAGLHPGRFELLPITYNAPPLWGVVREGKRFFATKFDTDGLHQPAHGRIPVRAIHCTSAVRHRDDLGLYFGDVYPEILERWNSRFAVR